MLNRQACASISYMDVSESAGRTPLDALSRYRYVQLRIHHAISLTIRSQSSLPSHFRTPRTFFVSRNDYVAPELSAHSVAVSPASPSVVMSNISAYELVEQMLLLLIGRDVGLGGGAKR